jgi:plastocyanin
VKRRLITIGLMTALVTSVALLPGVVGAEDVQPTTVSIIEPEGGTPQDWTFAPGELTVTIGQTVTWTNA